MKLSCLIRQRDFAHYLEAGEPFPGPPLATHLAVCQECRASWEALSHLSQALPQALTVPVPSDTFSQSMWARIEKDEKAKRARPNHRRYTLATLVLAALLLILFVSLPASSPRLTGAAPIQEATKPDFTGLSSNRSHAASLKEISSKQSLQPLKSVSLVAANAVPDAEIFPASPKITNRTWTSRPRAAVPKIVNRLMRHEAYGHHGNPLKTAELRMPLLAADRAARPHDQNSDSQRRDTLRLVPPTDASEPQDDSSETIDPNLAFAVGFTAEDNGDTAQALESYVSALHGDSRARAAQNEAVRG